MLITQGSEDRALLLAPSRTARTFLLGFAKSYHLYMFVENGRQAFVLFMLVVKVVESTGVLSLKNSYEPRQIFPPGVMSMIVALKSKSEDTPAG